MQNNALFEQLTKPQQMYVESIREIGDGWGYDLTKSNWTRKELVAISMKRQGNDDVPNWIVKDNARRVGRGVYAIPELPQLNQIGVAMETLPTPQGTAEAVSPGHGHEGDDLADSAPTVDPIDVFRQTHPPAPEASTVTVPPADGAAVADEYSPDEHTMIRKQ